MRLPCTAQLLLPSTIPATASALGSSSAAVGAPDGVCVHRDDERVVASVRGADRHDGLRTDRSQQARPPELAIGVAHQHVPDVHDGAAVPRLPGFGLGTEQPELDGERGRRGDERVDARCVRVEHSASGVVEGLVVGSRGGSEAQPSAVDVERERTGAEPLGKAALGPAAVVAHLPQAVLGVHETLREEGVVDRCRASVRDAERVAEDVNLGLETRHPDVPTEVGQRRGEAIVASRSSVTGDRHERGIRQYV